MFWFVLHLYQLKEIWANINTPPYWVQISFSECTYFSGWMSYMISVRCIPLNLISKTRRRATLLLLTCIYSCQSVGTVNITLPFTTSVTVLISILQTFRSLAATSHLRLPGVFISQLIRYARAISSFKRRILRAVRLSNKLLGQGYVKERLRSSLRKFYGQYGDLIKQNEVPLSRMLHDILDDDHLQWHPPLIRHNTSFLPYYWPWPYYRIWLLPNCERFS